MLCDYDGVVGTRDKLQQPYKYKGTLQILTWDYHIKGKTQ